MTANVISRSVGPIPKARVDPSSIHKDEIVIKRDRLAILEAKEIAHDDYLAATRLMGARVKRMRLIDSLPPTEYQEGYGQCLRDFCQLVVDQGRIRDALT